MLTCDMCVFKFKDAYNQENDEDIGLATVLASSILGPSKKCGSNRMKLLEPAL